MDAELVYWDKAYVSKDAKTLVHLATPTLGNEYGRTGCGKRYPRKRAHEYMADVADVECKSCLRALVSDHEDAH